MTSTGNTTFLSTPSARRATPISLTTHPRHTFLSTPSARRATLIKPCARFCGVGDFYPRPPRGGRPANSSGVTSSSLFLSTPSARRATFSGFCFLLTGQISIHALREEGDRGMWGPPGVGQVFLSTPSARRATGVCGDRRGWGRYFYPRPPRGGRPPGLFPDPQAAYISIHALREEGDLDTPPQLGLALVFLSTPSARRATSLLIRGVIDTKFLSTPSARRATARTLERLRSVSISIHALREEGD